MFQDFPEDNKGDDFLDDFRQKIASQSMDELEEKRSDLKRSKNVFIGAVSGMALAFVVGWIVLSPRYENTDTPEIPVVRRPQAPVKVLPVDPGGMEIQNQDKSVYDIVEKKDAEPVVENLLPLPEEPKIPEVIETDVMVEETAVAQSDVVDAIIEEARKEEASPAPVSQEPKVDVAAEQAKKKAEIAKQLNALTEKEEPKPAAKAPEKSIEKEIKDIIKVQESIQNRPVSYADAHLNKVTEPKRIAKIEATAPSEFDIDVEEERVAPVVEAPKAAPVNNGIPSGSWQLQLMSSPNKAGVAKAFASLSSKYPVLAGLPHEIEEADLGAKGMFYRLKAGAFKNRADADRACSDLKALGGTCIVKKK